MPMLHTGVITLIPRGSDVSGDCEATVSAFIIIILLAVKQEIIRSQAVAKTVDRTASQHTI